MEGDIVFDAAIIEWRGPAPFLFARLPDEYVGAIRYAALSESYLLPIKGAVQRSEGVGLGADRGQDAHRAPRQALRSLGISR